jgi:hypothetical protein
MLRHPAILCKGVWGDVDFVRVCNCQNADSIENLNQSAKFEGSHSGVAEDSSLQSCYGMSAGKELPTS